MFGRKRESRDFSTEIEAHIALETDRLRAQGYSEADAGYAARRAFGNVTRAEERFHESTGWVWWDNLSADIRYALRGLLKAPGFTLAVLATLALGIGANTAIFTVFNTVLLHPLPYPDSNRIVNISRPGAVAAMPMYIFWQQNNPGFLDLTAYQPDITLNLTGGDKPRLIDATSASQNYFRLFGANPILGRTFSAEEDHLGGPKVLVMSYALW
jgi:putative ABC transport system permease protein